MDNTEHNLIIRIKGETAEIVGASKKAASSVETVGVESDKAATKINRLDKETRQASQSAGLLQRGYSLLKGAVVGLGLSYAATQFTQTIGETQTLNIRIQELSASTSEYRENQEFLRQSARDLRKDYFVLADGYSKLLALQKGGLTTQKESRKLLTGLTDTSAALGASSAQLGQSLFGLSQGLSSNVLRAEELNQVVEPMPGLLQAIDKAAGLAAGGFRQMVNDGQVTSEFFKATLIEAFKEFEGAAARAGKTIPGAFQDISNAYAEIAGQLEQPVSAALVPVLEAVADGLRALPEYKDEAKALLIVLTSYAAARFIPPLFLAMKTQALRAAAAFKTTGVATNALGQRMKQATLLSRGFSLALGALGGPAGIAIAAASALALYAASAEDAEPPTERLRKEVEKLSTEFDNLTQEQLALKLVTGASKAKLLTAEISKLQAELRALNKRNDKSFGGVDEDAIVLKNRITALTKELNDLEVNLEALGKIRLDKGGWIDNNDVKAAESLDKNVVKVLGSMGKYAAALSNQTALFGKSKQEARLFNVEQKILEQRSKLGTKATDAQVISFEKFADKARESARALNQLERSQKAFNDLSKENQETAKIVDFAAEHAVRIKQESDSYAASAALRNNAHQARLAQIKGNISDENLIRQQQFDLEHQQELTRYANQQTLADSKFRERQAKLSEQFKLTLENEQLNEQQRSELFLELELQQEELATARRTEKEAAILAHENKIVDIKQRSAELQAQIDKATHDQAVAGLGQMFANLASTYNTQSRRQFEQQKKAKIAETVINTYSSATKAYDALAGIPYVGPYLGAAAAAAAIYAGLKNVKRIKAQKFDAGAAGASNSYSAIGGGASNVTPISQSPNYQPNQTTQQDLAAHNESNFQSGTTGLTVNIYETKAAEEDPDVLLKSIEGYSIDPDSRFAQSVKRAVNDG
jgi:tape measure domain-containing protein